MLGSRQIRLYCFANIYRWGFFVFFLKVANQNNYFLPHTTPQALPNTCQHGRESKITLLTWETQNPKSKSFALTHHHHQKKKKKRKKNPAKISTHLIKTTEYIIWGLSVISEAPCHCHLRTGTSVLSTSINVLCIHDIRMASFHNLHLYL
jgi:hypothetical protein